MQATATFLPYESTGNFTKIVSDYLQVSPLLQPFYLHTPDLNGIKKAIEARMAFNTPRGLLVEELKAQYASLSISEKVIENIDLLSDKKTFTITTAHQPNIFTGPLYFIYKIMHAIRLADELKNKLPQYHFVPVYYMGSEDADLDELGHVTVGGMKMVWNTQQTGAVGRMKVDKKLVAIMDAIFGQIGVLPFGNALNEIFAKCYTSGKTIQQATLELVNELFGVYGLVVLQPDNGNLKKAFHSVIERELLEGFSHTIVADTIEQLGKQYKVQAGGREINLFYLIDDKRERIERTMDGVEVKTLGLHFTKDAILKELASYPERFSANVILRGAFQETVLPNIAFIGGGGELAYWLELKNVFEAVQIPYPVLLLRNSFLIMTSKEASKLQGMGFSASDLFLEAMTLWNILVKKSSQNQLSLDAEIGQAQALYDQLQNLTDKVDKTLAVHVKALAKQALKKLLELEKKILRAERAKFETQRNQITSLKAALFPNNSLQERVENFSLFYARYGNDWLHKLYDESDGFQKGFGVLTLLD